MPLGSQTSRRAFDMASRNDTDTKPTPRASEMVAQDKPHPAPRPSPGWADGPDREAFNAKWKRERTAADQQRDDRKEAFKALRRAEQAQTRRRTFNRQAAL